MDKKRDHKPIGPPGDRPVREYDSNLPGEARETPPWKWGMIICLAFAITAFLAPYTPSRAILSPAWLQLTMGLLILLLTVFYIFYKDIRRYKPMLADNRNHLLLLCILLGGTVGIMRIAYFLLSILADQLPGAHIKDLIYVIPVAAGSMLVTLLFDVHLALVFSFVISLISAVIIRETPLFPVFAFCGSLVGAFSVMKCTKRTDLIRAGIQVGAINLLTVAGINLFHQTFFTSENLYHLFFAFMGGIVVSTIVSGALPALESAFDIATDIRLLELLDMNQPLLKRLLLSAPGTYHHSIIVGNLAEAAADAIGVNPLTARVASFYHDIGKVTRPEFFIENQAAGPNPHDKLTPENSARIITSHTRDGVELALEQRLPPFIVDVIAQHHGTSVITYFHEKAKEKSKEGQTVNASDYRYDGPKPHSRIAAIIMLSDACEAAARALSDPTPDRIATVVNRVITNKFIDDQLNDCDLTLKDLQTITTSINHTLCGIFHQRIDYPGMTIDEETRRANPDKRHPAYDKAGKETDREGRDDGTLGIKGRQR